MTLNSRLNVSEQEQATQQLFRILLDCMARPGKIATVDLAQSVLDMNLPPAVANIAITLLDQEVSFHIVSDEGRSSTMLQVYTLAKSTEFRTCDFVFLRGTDDVDVRELKRGTLGYPDESATVVCAVERLAGSASAQSGVIKLTLFGAGIKDSRSLFIHGMDEQMMTRWQMANQEYPLGIDWILVDDAGQVCCLPRSTQIVWEVL